MSGPQTRFSPPGARPARTAERGFALLLVLWLGVMIGVMAAAFAFSARTEARIGRSSLERAQASFLADAALKRAALGLTARVSDHRYKADGRAYTWPFAGAQLRISLSPESGKLDLNRAPDLLVEGLFEVLADDGLLEEADARALADAVLDFRDKDKSRRTDGAESPEYSRAGLPYGAANRPLLTVSELGQVLGMTSGVMERIAPLVTVHARSSRIDGMTAPRDLLRALPGVTPEQVDEFLSARAQVRQELIDADESLAGQAFGAASATGGVGGAVGSAPSTTQDRSSALRSGRRGAPIELLGAQAGRYVSRGSARVYAVRVRGKTAGGGPVRRDAVIRVPGRGGRAYSLLAWSTAGPGS